VKTRVSYVLLDPFLLGFTEVQDEYCRKKSQHIIPVACNLFPKIILIIIIIIIIFIILYTN